MSFTPAQLNDLAERYTAAWNASARKSGSIPEAEIPEIFEPFGQVWDPLVREQQRTGLGLSIVKSIIELHNFAIRIYSCEGKGEAVKIQIS